jgi:hypothetical protein
MRVLTWIFLICCIVFIGLYTYNYLITPRLNDLKTNNDCLNENDIDQYGLFEQNNYQIILPKEWSFAKLNMQIPKNTFIFSTNVQDPYEFFSIWTGDYNKTSKDLLIDTLMPLKNYTIENQKSIINEKDIELKHMIINFKGETRSFTQEIFTYVKDNKGYLILIRNNSQNQYGFEDTLKKIICSFNVN